MQKVAIIILNYGDKALEDTKACLRSLNTLNCPDLQLKIFMVVYGQQNSLEIANILTKTSDYPTQTEIRKNENLGFATANNLGIENSIKWGADYLLLLNNDTIIDPGFLSPLINYLQENNKVAAVSPKIYFTKGREFYKNRYTKTELGKIIWYAGGKLDWKNVYASHIGVDEVDHGQYKDCKTTEFTSGCTMLIKTSAWKEVGIFNEDLFLYWEDVEWCLRAKRNGWRVAYCGKAHIWHNNAGSSAVGSNSQNYFLTRNRLWIGFHYAKLRTKLALLRQALLQSISANYWTKKGILDFLFKKMQRGSWPH